jgi:methionyl-tRNA formyltransferase
LRLLFFGSSRLSCLVLEGLLASRHTVAAVVTQPDQPAGRRMELRATPVGSAAAAAGLAVFKPRRLKHNSDLQTELQGLAVDALAVASYGKLIPVWLLELTPWPLNVHPSPLPLQRGPSPLRTALLEGWHETQCCIMRMTERIDDGPVLLRSPLAIPGGWNYEELESAAGTLGGALLASALDGIAQGTVALTPQTDSAATYTRVFTREDTWLDWSLPAERLADFVRAWDPDLGACTGYFHKDAVRRLKVWRAEPAAAEGAAAAQAGTVLLADKGELLVQAGAGALRLLEVQPENRPRMPVASFMAGQQLAAGMVLHRP